MDKYKARDWHPNIVKVEVEKQTDKSVWINGRRSAKITDYESYFSTWEEAKKHLLSRVEGRLNTARRQLERAQGEYGNIKGMKKPEAE